MKKQQTTDDSLKEPISAIPLDPFKIGKDGKQLFIDTMKIFDEKFVEECIDKNDDELIYLFACQLLNNYIGLVEFVDNFKNDFDDGIWRDGYFDEDEEEFDKNKESLNDDDH